MFPFWSSDNYNKSLNKNNIVLCKEVTRAKNLAIKGGSSSQSVRQTLCKCTIGDQDMVADLYVSIKRNIYLYGGYAWKVKNVTHDGCSNHTRSIICIWL